MSSPRNFILTDFNLRRLQVLGAPSSLDGDPGRPGGLLRPAGGHRSGKQLRTGYRAQPEDPHAAPCGEALAPPPAAPSPGARSAPAVILATLTGRCGQREGTGLGSSCALYTGSEIHMLRPAVGPGTASGGSGLCEWSQASIPMAVAVLIGRCARICARISGMSWTHAISANHREPVFLKGGGIQTERTPVQYSFLPRCQKQFRSCISYTRVRYFSRRFPA